MNETIKKSDKKNKLPYFNSKTKNTHNEIVNILADNFSMQKKKEFIERKKEFIKRNKVMNDEEFKELFGSLWKYDKNEIVQNNWLWLCFVYTWFEILKKTNFFKELIQTNFKKVWKWKWEIRIPFCNKNWYWIKVNINEIFNKDWKDKELSFISRKSNKGKTVKITTWSSLWFKILEIAFMKSYLIFNPRYSSETRDTSAIISRWIYNLTWDFELNGQWLRALEGWNVWQFMQHLLWPDIVKYNDPDTDKEHNLKNIIQEYNTWFIKITLTSKSKNNFWLKNWNIKILNKEKNIISDKFVNKKNGTNWIFQIIIQWNHAYSIEKFYKSSIWEYRVWIINPRNTAEKIDISLNQCKDFFDRQIIWFDIDKMFK